MSNRNGNLATLMRQRPVSNLLKASKRTRVAIGRRRGLGIIGAAMYSLILSHAAHVVYGTPLTQAEKNNEGLILSHAAVGLPLPVEVLQTNSAAGQMAISHPSLNFKSGNLQKLSSSYINNLEKEMTQIMQSGCSWQISASERNTSRGFMGGGLNKLLGNRNKFCSSETSVALAPLRTVGEEIQKTFVALQGAQLLEAQNFQIQLVQKNLNAARNEARKAQNALQAAQTSAAVSKTEINALRARAARAEERANTFQKLATSTVNIATAATTGVGGIIQETGQAGRSVMGIVTAGGKSAQNATGALSVIAVSIAALSAIGLTSVPLGWGLRAIRKFKREAHKNSAAYADEIAREAARIIEEKIKKGELKRLKQTSNTGTSPNAHQKRNTSTSPKARQANQRQTAAATRIQAAARGLLARRQAERRRVNARRAASLRQGPPSGRPSPSGRIATTNASNMTSAQRAARRANLSRPLV